jgi:hypothetical protein
MRQQGTIHEYMCCLIASHITVDDVRVDMLALKIEWQIQDRVALIDPDRNPRIAVKKRAGHSVVLPVDAMVPDCADMQPREAALTIGVHES